MEPLTEEELARIQEQEATGLPRVEDIDPALKTVLAQVTVLGNYFRQTLIGKLKGLPNDARTVAIIEAEIGNLRKALVFKKLPTPDKGISYAYDGKVFNMTMLWSNKQKRELLREMGAL